MTKYAIDGGEIGLHWGMRFVESYWKTLADSFIDESTGGVVIEAEDLLALLLFCGHSAYWKEFGGVRQFKSLQAAYAWLRDKANATDFIQFQESIVNDFQESMDYKKSLDTINENVDDLKKKLALAI